MSEKEMNIQEASEENVEEISQEESEMESLREENAALKDRLVRALADLENDRKRFERERSDASKFSISSFARDLLGVADNLSRVLENISEEERKENTTLDTLFQGIFMTEEELKKLFVKNHIEKIDPKGEKFDHNLHQAMFEVKDTDQEEGTVVEVMQVGYKLHDRLLRPAMVGVAKP